MQYQHPLYQLRKISPKPKQIWPVIYVKRENTNRKLANDLEVVMKAQCDACVLEMNTTPELLDSAIKFATKEFPQLKIGVNYLGGPNDPYGFIHGFEIAQKYHLPIIWTDFSGVDLIEEHPEVSLHEIEYLRPPNAFYCSGIHMKYGTLKNTLKSIEQSAYQAMGWVDGIIMTGKKTGDPTDTQKVKNVRKLVGNYPLGIASGLSIENALELLPWIDFALVNSSIADKEHHLIYEKVKTLAALFHQFK